MECKKAVGNKLLEKAMSKHWVSLLLPFEVQVVVPGTPLCPCCSAGIRALCSVCSAGAHKPRLAQAHASYHSAQGLIQGEFSLPREVRAGFATHLARTHPVLLVTLP